MNKTIIYSILVILFAFYSAALTIESPEESVYSTKNILLLITSNVTFDNITYQLNNDTTIIACQNCSLVNETLVLEQGNYTIAAKAFLGNETTSQEVSFSVEINDTPDNISDFSLTLISPVNTTYNETEINVSVDSDKTLDLLSYILNENSEIILCQNCSGYSASISALEGENTLTVKGLLNETEKEVSVIFTVQLNVTVPEDNETGDNETEPDETGEPRFSLGFNKLPKALMNDEITDEELADIVYSNKLNPGIINRLIKTGKLGDASMQAILSTQFNPPGILRKLLSFFGFKHRTHAELIYENYNVSAAAEQKLLARDDLPEEYANNIKKNLRKRFEKKFEKKAEEKTEEKIEKKEIKSTDSKPKPTEPESFVTAKKTKSKNIYKAGRQNGKKLGQNKPNKSAGRGKSPGKSNNGKGNKGKK